MGGRPQCSALSGAFVDVRRDYECLMENVESASDVAERMRGCLSRLGSCS